MGVWTQLIAGGFSLLIGAAALLWAIRGQRIGDEPHCRRCGYDLRGLPDAVTRCSECGADVSTPRAIRRGTRRVRRPWFAAALILLCPAAILLTNGIRIVRRTDWQSLKPVWWLTYELRSADQTTRILADGELYRRLVLNSLSDDQVVSIAQLPRGSVAGRPFVASVSVDCAVRARSRGLMPDAQWDAFCQQSHSVMIVAGRKVHAGDPLQFGVRHGDVATGHAVVTSTELVRESASVDGQELTVERAVRHESYIPNRGHRGGGSGQMGLRLQPDEWDSTRLGEHVIQCTVLHAASFEGRTKLSGGAKTRSILEWRFEVVPVDQPIVDMTVDPNIRQAMKDSLAPSSIHARSQKVAISLGSGQMTPADGAFEVFLRSGTTELSVGSFTVGKDCGTYGWFQLKQIPERINPAKFDVILRPSQDVAKALPGARWSLWWYGTGFFEQIWGEPIEYRNVASSNN